MEENYISKQENSITFQMVKAAVKKRKTGIKREPIRHSVLVII